MDTSGKGIGQNILCMLLADSNRVCDSNISFRTSNRRVLIIIRLSGQIEARHMFCLNVVKLDVKLDANKLLYI